MTFDKIKTWGAVKQVGSIGSGMAASYVIEKTLYGAFIFVTEEVFGKRAGIFAKVVAKIGIFGISGWVGTKVADDTAETLSNLDPLVLMQSGEVKEGGIYVGGENA